MGPYWTPISPSAGSFFHADTHLLRISQFKASHQVHGGLNTQPVNLFAETTSTTAGPFAVGRRLK